MDYYVSRMKDVSITTINEFETEDENGTKVLPDSMPVAL